ncbi:MAG: hypothetical protein GC205_11665 [Bacteroidetes bacterium]|nr:hypothetical protein [Bacteroidota bacterium]
MVLDVVLGILLAIAFGYGWSRGLVRSLLAAVSVLVAVVAAVKLSQVASFWLRDALDLNATWLPLVSLLAVFVAVMTLFYLAGTLLESTLQALALGAVNRIAGGMVYAGVAALLLSTLLWYSTQMNLIPQANREGSALLPAMLTAAPGVLQGAGQVLPAVQDAYGQLELFFEQLATDLEPAVDQEACLTLEPAFGGNAALATAALAIPALATADESPSPAARLDRCAI